MAEKNYARKKELNRLRMQRVAARNKELLDQWKINQRKCCDCARQITIETKHHFDIDHVDPTHKKYDNLRTVTNMDALIQELDKCVMRCALCHRDRSMRLKHHLVRNPGKPYEPLIEYPQLFKWPA